VAQQYQPQELQGRRYYRPSRHGAEAALRRDTDGEDGEPGSGA